MNENYIICEGSPFSFLFKILADFSNLYKQNAAASGLQLYKKRSNPESFLLLFSKTPDFDLFSFLVNYLEYPIGYEKGVPFVRGFYRTQDIEKQFAGVKGEWLMVYVDYNPDEADNVHFANEADENWLYCFSGKINPLRTTVPFDLILPTQESYTHEIDVVSDADAEERKQKPWWKFW